MTEVTFRADSLAALSQPTSLGAKLDWLYQDLNRRDPCVHRMAVALFDPSANRLHTYIASGDAASPLTLYETGLEQAPELLRVMETGQIRVIQDLAVYRQGSHPHTVSLRQAGFQASCTLPYFWNGRFEAFVFFNSRDTGVFTGEVLADLELYGHLAGSMVMGELAPVRTLMAALRNSVRMIHLKDPETGGHLERMAGYTRLISLNLAKSGKQTFDDEFIAHLTAFAPLHDIGKIGIPDQVLMKDGPLDDRERAIMQHHPAMGRHIVDGILADFGLEGLAHAELLRQVAEGHHEKLDGSGYPHAFKGTEVPIAARIIAVADIFDALTSRRPYKEPWSNDQAFQHLLSQSERRLDRDCVAALMEDPGEVARIQETFAD